MSRTLRWSLMMTAFGLTSAAIALVVTGSWWWALAGLLGSGIVANSIASARAGARNGRRPT